MTRILFSLLISCFCLTLAAQDTFTFRYNMEEMNDVQNESDIQSHFLGEEIATKMQLLKEIYTFKEKDEISLTERTVVEKSSIYYSVKKMNRHLKKEIKSGTMTEAQATEAMNNILNIALNIRYQDTQALEDLLWSIKDTEEIAALYSSRIKLEM